MNIEKAKKEFEKFVKQYDLEFPKMKTKYGHCYRVMDNAKKIAISLNLNNEEIDLATLIGLLHDIGHFEQTKIQDILKQNTKIDHGDYGVEILQKDNYIRQFIEEEKYDNIIFKAVKNHNKFKIEDGLPEKELLFSRIIRDADKLDIFYEAAEMFWTKPEQIEEINNSNISEKIIEEYRKNMSIHRKECITKVDEILNVLSFIYDINFKYDFKILKKENYINKILDRFQFQNEETAKQINEIRIIANEYIEKQL